MTKAFKITDASKLSETNELKQMDIKALHKKIEIRQVLAGIVAVVIFSILYLLWINSLGFNVSMGSSTNFNCRLIQSTAFMLFWANYFIIWVIASLVIMIFVHDITGYILVKKHNLNTNDTE